MRIGKPPMGEHISILENAIFLCLSGLAAVLVLSAVGMKRAPASALVMLAGVLAVGGLYVMLDAYFAAMAHTALLGSCVFKLVLSGEGDAGGGFRRGGRRGLLVPLAVSAAVFLVLLYLSLAFPWDIVYESSENRFASIPVIGDGLATTWILPVEMAPLLLVAALAGSMMILGERKRR
jgi:NADH:ubiquinone oxidoreductase subunit 6 (subunit J)